MSWRRATSDTTIPGSKASATMAILLSSGHLCRRPDATQPLHPSWPMGFGDITIDVTMVVTIQPRGTEGSMIPTATLRVAGTALTVEHEIVALVRPRRPGVRRGGGSAAGPAMPHRPL